MPYYTLLGSYDNPRINIEAEVFLFPVFNHGYVPKEISLATQAPPQECAQCKQITRVFPKQLFLFVNVRHVLHCFNTFIYYSKMCLTSPEFCVP